MTGSDALTTHTASEPDLMAASAKRQRIVATIIVVSLLLVALAFPVVHWFNSLNLVSGSGDGMTQSGVPVGPTSVSLELQPLERGVNDQLMATIVIDSITPVIAQNTTGATYRIVTCATPNSSAGPIVGPTSSFDVNCVRGRAANGSTFPLVYGRGLKSHDLAANYVPKHAGVLDVTGYILKYHQGLRHATATVGTASKVTFINSQ